MNTKPRIKTILPLAAVAAAFTLAPTAQADTIAQSSSDDLNLTDRTVLAAVNFHDPTPGDRNHPTVGSIQGVDFDDFNVVVDDTGSPIALAAGTPGATLSTIISQGVGREFGSDPTLLGFSGPDATEAEKLAFGGMYFQDSETATLTFAFGGSYANTDVEIQMLGGGIWARTDRQGKLVMSVDSVELGELVDRGTPDLLTFLATTDNSGNLVIDVVNQNVDGSFGARQYTMLTGTIVTVAGPAASISITSITSVDPLGTWELTLEGKSDTAYEFRSSTTLEFDPGDLVTGLTATVGAISGGSLEFVTTNGDGDATVEMMLTGPTNFVRAQRPPPVTLLDEDFEGDNGGFTFETTSGSPWEHGVADSDGTVGEVTGGNGNPLGKCWGTNIGPADGGDVAASTVTTLRSSVIDLTGVAGAELTFAQALDLEGAPPTGDLAVVNIIEEIANVTVTGGAAVYTANDSGEPNAVEWAGAPAIDLTPFVGQKVRVEWVLTTGSGTDYLGWYVDDVVVIGTP